MTQIDQSTHADEPGQQPAPPLPLTPSPADLPLPAFCRRRRSTARARSPAWWCPAVVAGCSESSPARSRDGGGGRHRPQRAQRIARAAGQRGPGDRPRATRHPGGEKGARASAGQAARVRARSGERGRPQRAQRRRAGAVRLPRGAAQRGGHRRRKARGRQQGDAGVPEARAAGAGGRGRLSADHPTVPSTANRTFEMHMERLSRPESKRPQSAPPRQLHEAAPVQEL